MEVYGDLVSAGLEKLDAHPTEAGAYLGRIYYNTADNVAYFYDGSNWNSMSGGVADSLVIDVSVADTSGFSVLDPIYHNGTTWVAANTTSADTLAEYVITEIIDGTDMKISKFGKFTVSSHGLTVGEHYFQQGTSYSTTENSSYSVPLFYILDSNTVLLELLRPLDKRVVPPELSGSDGDLTILNGQTVTLTEGDIKDYSNIDVQSGGILEVDCSTDNGFITQIYSIGTFNVDGEIRAINLPSTANISGNTLLGDPYNFVQTATLGGAGGAGGNAVSGASGGAGGAGAAGYGGGGGGGAGAGASGAAGGTNNASGSSTTAAGGVGNLTLSAGGAGGNGVNNSSTSQVGGDGGGSGGGAGAYISGLGIDNIGGGGGGGGYKPLNGSAIYLWSLGDITGAGTINVSGTDGFDGGNGGNAYSDNGGSGNACGGGGGGGGAGGAGGTVYYTATSILPTVDISGGIGGSGGGAGTSQGGGSASSGSNGSNGNGGSVVEI